MQLYVASDSAAGVTFVSIPLKVSQLNVFIPILNGEIALFHNWTLTFLTTFPRNYFIKPQTIILLLIYIENIFIT